MITSIRQEECTRNEEVDTAYPGVMQSVMELAQAGMAKARTNVGYEEVSFAGELLILAGLSLLLSADGDKSSKSCIRFANLAMNGETLPRQTVFVATQLREEPEAPVVTSPVRHFAPEMTYEDGVQEQRVYQDPAQESMYQSIPADARADMEAQLREFEEQFQRFAGEPSVASEGRPIPKRVVKSRIPIPKKGMMQAGLTARRDIE